MKATFTLLALATVAISATQAVKYDQQISAIDPVKEEANTYIDIP
jgi:hypothetical protein